MDLWNGRYAWELIVVTMPKRSVRLYVGTCLISLDVAWNLGIHSLAFRVDLLHDSSSIDLPNTIFLIQQLLFRACS